MNFWHNMPYILAGAFGFVGLLVACFLIGFVVTCGVWKADAFMDRLDARREVRNAVGTVDEDYERLCEEQE